MTADTVLSARALRKQRGLRGMQRLNAMLLLASLALLLLCVLYQPRWPWLHWLQAFAEASAIGAMADWYAVVALFRRPLGLPIPHSAIIPRHKDSIGESLGEFVSQHLLTPENIGNKLQHYDMARHLAQWLEQSDNAEQLAEAIAGYLPGLLRAPDDTDLRRFFQNSVAPLLLRLDAASFGSRLVLLLMDLGLHHAALNRGLAVLDHALIANEELIRAKFAQASKYTPAFLDGYIVRKFLEGIRTLVHDVVSEPGHALRALFDDSLRELAQELRQSPGLRDSARGWLRQSVQSLSDDQDLRRLRDRLAASAEADIAQPDSVLRRYGAVFIRALAQGVLRDQAILDRLNTSWLRLARTATVRHGGQISSLIAEVVKSWDANEVGRKIELEIGRDLQFIRINGALVGGTVGVALHACTLAIR